MARTAKSDKTGKTALKAVEDALAIDFEEPNLAESDDDSLFEELETRLAKATVDLRDEGQIPEIESFSADVSVDDQEDGFNLDTNPVPANDDHDQSIADLLYTIQQKSSSRVYWYTGLASLVWIGLCWYYARANSLFEFSDVNSLKTFLSSPEGLMAIFVLGVPIILLWAFATMVRRAQEMRHAANTMTEAAIRLLHPENVANGAVSTVGRAIRREVAAMGDGVERAIARAGELQYLVQNEVMNLERSYGDSEFRMRRLVEEIGNEREEVVGYGDKLRESIADTHAGLNEELQLAGKRIEDTVHSATEKLNVSIDERRELISATLSEAGENLSTILTTNSENLNSRLIEGKAELEASVEQKSKELSNVVSTAGRVVAKLIETRTATMREEGMELTRQLEDSIAMRSSEFSSRISEAGDVIQSALDDKLNAFDESLNTQGSNLVSALGMRTEALDKLLQDRTELISGKIADQTSEFSSRISQVGETVQSALDDKLAAIDASFTTQGGNLVSALGMRTEALDKVLQQRSEIIGDTIAGSLSGFSEALTGHVSDTVDKLQTQTETLQANTKSVEEVIIKRTRGVEDALKKGTVDLAETIGESIQAVAGKSEAITKLLSERAAAIQASLGKNLSDAQNTLEDKTREFNELLASRTSELSGIIENDAKPVVASIEKAGAAVTAKLSVAHDKIAIDANALFTRIGESSELLESLIEQASSNLGAMQKDISGQTERFANAVLDTKNSMEESSDIAKDVQARLESTGTTILENMNDISQRFETQGTMLQEATRLIDAAQLNFETTLEAKQETLQQLAVGLVSRSDEINKTMASFGEMITTMVNEVGERSKGVGEAVSAEISIAIDQATARFTETAEAMRGAAETVRNELEETRTQMRRGVLELPDETHQSATAMRRVVADQVAALRELSDIVKKSGKMLDASPAANPLPAPSSQFPVVNTPAPAPQPAAAFPPRTSAGPQIPPSPPVRHAPPPPLQPLRTATAAMPTLDPNLHSTSDPAVEHATQTAPQQNAGWVSDLLQRASSDDVPPPPPLQGSNQQGQSRPPLHVVESLNSLSMDIARAIDHETSVELWERYQRGERNVFTRRLYTLQGQQTFDDIRNKYQREHEFRAAVDRYIEDFERLLSDVSSNDRDSIMTQTYLTSDTGKVYTMLAHASGKLSNG